MATLLHHLVCWIETAVMTVINLAIVGIAAAMQAIFNALPAFPSITTPTLIQTGYAWIAYWFPIDWFFTNLVVFIAFAVAWWLISIPLRTVRAIPGSE